MFRGATIIMLHQDSLESELHVKFRILATKIDGSNLSSILFIHFEALEVLLCSLHGVVYYMEGVVYYMDPARHLLARFAQQFTYGMDDCAAFNQTITELPHQYQEVADSSLQYGLLPPIEIGEEFRYRNQIRLAGLHNDRIRGIYHHNGIATSVVAKYPFHNFDAQDAEVAGLYVSGEGGLIRDAHRHRMRVLEHQRLSPGNVSMFNAHVDETSVRVVAFGEIQGGGNNVGNNNAEYVFCGVIYANEC